MEREFKYTYVATVWLKNEKRFIKEEFGAHNFYDALEYAKTFLLINDEELFSLNCKQIVL